LQQIRQHPEVGHDYHWRQRLAVTPEFKCPKKESDYLYERAVRPAPGCFLSMRWDRTREP